MTLSDFHRHYTIPAHLQHKWEQLIQAGRYGPVMNMAAAIVAINERERHLSAEQVRESIEQADAMIDEALTALRDPATWVRALAGVSKADAINMMRRHDDLVRKFRLEQVINQAWKTRYAPKAQ